MSNEAQPGTGQASVTPVRGWRAAFPPAQWIPAYQAQWLRNDATAAVTLAAYGIPVSLAYASLAGLPPQYGTYCYLVGGLFYGAGLRVGPISHEIALADVMDEFQAATGS